MAVSVQEVCKQCKTKHTITSKRRCKVCKSYFPLAKINTGVISSETGWKTFGICTKCLLKHPNHLIGNNPAYLWSKMRKDYKYDKQESQKMPALNKVNEVGFFPENGAAGIGSYVMMKYSRCNNRTTSKGKVMPCIEGVTTISGVQSKVYISSKAHINALSDTHEIVQGLKSGHSLFLFFVSIGLEHGGRGDYHNIQCLYAWSKEELIKEVKKEFNVDGKPFTFGPNDDTFYHCPKIDKGNQPGDVEVGLPAATDDNVPF